MLRSFSMIHILPMELVNALEKDLIKLLVLDRADLSSDSKHLISMAHIKQRVIYIIKDDLIMSDLTPAELSSILWHEYWHIHSRTSDEEACDKYAIMHTSQEIYLSAISKTKKLMKIFGKEVFSDKYKHRER